MDIETIPKPLRLASCHSGGCLAPFGLWCWPPTSLVFRWLSANEPKFVAGSTGSIRSARAGCTAKAAAWYWRRGRSAAHFSISGDPNWTCAITLPGDGSVSLINGANSMALNTCASSPNLTGQLSASGTQTPSVGGRRVHPPRIHRRLRAGGHQANRQLGATGVAGASVLMHD